MTKLNLNTARLLSEINLTWQKKRGLKNYRKKPPPVKCRRRMETSIAKSTVCQRIKKGYNHKQTKPTNHR